MNSQQLLHALGEVDERFAEEATPQKINRKRRRPAKWIALAACLCAVAVCIPSFFHHKTETPPDDRIIVTEDGVVIPPLNLSLSATNGAASDMLAFFIYQGRTYCEYTWIDNAGQLIGEKLGTAIGLINEWTPIDGYVEFAGSVAGDFFSVNGYDPSFMLCMPHDNGRVLILINDNGITLKTGADLYETRLHLSETLSSVSYQSRYNWYYSIGEPTQLNPEHMQTVRDFIDTLNAAAFIPCSAIPLENGKTLVDTETWHMYIQSDSGMITHLRLSENGYVRFQGLWDVCVQVDEEIFRELIDCFRQ